MFLYKFFITIIMSYLLELNSLSNPNPDPNPQPHANQTQKLISLICSQLKQRNISFVLKQSKLPLLKLYFSIQLQQNHQNIHKWTFNLDDGSITQSIFFIPFKQIPSNLPTSMIKYLLRTIRFINEVRNRKMGIGMMLLHPYSGQIKIKMQANNFYWDTITAKLNLFKSTIIQSTAFMNQFSTLILHYCNRIPSILLTQSLPKYFHFLYLRPQDGQFKSLTEIRELISIRNVQIQQNLINPIQNIHQIAQETIQKIKRSHNELLNTHKSLSLWNQPPLYQPPISHKNIPQGLQRMTLPKETNSSFIFNTITIINEQKDCETLISQGDKIKLTALPIKFSYSQSRNPQQQLVDQQSQQQTIQMGTFTKKMVVKMPILRNNVEAIQKLKWQKNILTNLRGTQQSLYLPKYYHTIQDHFNVKVGILMDYVNGSTLHQMHQSRTISASLFTFLRIAYKIANALRFLSKHNIAHLDLTPANIIIDRGNQVKIIDFGEAYNKNTHRNYQLRKQKYRYRPGQSYPFFPPQIYLKNSQFTSQQDIYSLGIILFNIFFGKYPLTNSQKQLQKLYRKKGQLANRIFFVPQANQSLGPIELYNTISALILTMLDSDEKRRPLPVWMHLLLKKLSFLATK